MMSIHFSWDDIFVTVSYQFESPTMVFTNNLEHWLVWVCEVVPDQFGKVFQYLPKYLPKYLPIGNQQEHQDLGGGTLGISFGEILGITLVRTLVGGTLDGGTLISTLVGGTLVGNLACSLGAIFVGTLVRTTLGAILGTTAAQAKRFEKRLEAPGYICLRRIQERRVCVLR